MSIEEKYRESICIVYPATAPAEEHNLPIDREINCHVTVSFLGDIPTLNEEFSKDDIVTVLRSIDWEVEIEAGVKSLELFGPNNDFLVMTLESLALQKNRVKVSEALKNAGIPNMDKYSDYRPHITLMHDYEGELPVPEAMPSGVQLGTPTLWWGTEVIPLG